MPRVSAPIDRRLALLLAAIGPSAAGGEQRPPADRPNIVLIVADDMGYGDIGVHGCEEGRRDEPER